MAEGLDLLRRQYKHVVTGAMGRAPSNRRQLAGELEWDTLQLGLLALPTDVTALVRLQDPATGDFPFMFDFSSWGGPDAWL